MIYKRAQAALSKSGTVTLELALMGVPIVVAHRVHPLTYWVGRLMVRGIFTLPCPIFWPAKGSFQSLSNASTLRNWLAVLDLPQSQPTNLQALGPKGASQRAAAAVHEKWV